MAHRLCPRRLGYLLASPLRRWLQDPGVILGPYVSEGMTVLEQGPGTGFALESRPAIARGHAVLLVKQQHHRASVA